MPSDLYQRAVDLLAEEERTTLGAFEARLGDHPGIGGDPVKGGRVLANLREEAHLVGDGAFGEAGELAAFLRACAAGQGGTETADGFHGCYAGACGEFQGKGLRIPREHLPDGLLRYTTNRFLLTSLLERVVSLSARDDFRTERMTAETAVGLIGTAWDPVRAGACRLGTGRAVFATFEHDGGAPRDDAVGITQALAMRLWQKPRKEEDLVIELSYSVASVADPRFPTVADAEWSHLFKPAPERLPDGTDPETCWGWTEPVGARPPQPEIVHGNAGLEVLDRPPRLVGLITL